MKHFHDDVYGFSQGDLFSLYKNVITDVERSSNVTLNWQKRDVSKLCLSHRITGQQSKPLGHWGHHLSKKALMGNPEAEMGGRVEVTVPSRSSGGRGGMPVSATPMGR